MQSAQTAGIYSSLSSPFQSLHLLQPEVHWHVAENLAIRLRGDCRADRHLIRAHGLLQLPVQPSLPVLLPHLHTVAR